MIFAIYVDERDEQFAPNIAFGLYIGNSDTVTVEKCGLRIYDAGPVVALETHSQVVFFMIKENVRVETTDGPKFFGRE